MVASDFCQTCTSQGVRLYELNGHMQCAPCVFASAQEFGGFGFGPHGRKPWAVVQQIYADMETDRELRHSSAISETA